jgi:hypothetical protein
MTGLEPDIQAAPDELVELARKMRPHWDHDVLANAILAARNAGWTWTRTLTETVRLMCQIDASPFDLKAAAAHPFRGTESRTPAWQDRAAEARERLMHRNDDGSAA